MNLLIYGEHYKYKIYHCLCCGGSAFHFYLVVIKGKHLKLNVFNSTPLPRHAVLKGVAFCILLLHRIVFIRNYNLIISRGFYFSNYVTISHGIKHSSLKYWIFSQKNRFSGMLFHHVIKHYSIQVGNSQDLGVAEDWILGGKHHIQPDARLLPFNSFIVVVDG